MNTAFYIVLWWCIAFVVLCFLTALVSKDPRRWGWFVASLWGLIAFVLGCTFLTVIWAVVHVSVYGVKR